MKKAIISILQAVIFPLVYTASQVVVTMIAVVIDSVTLLVNQGADIALYDVAEMTEELTGGIMGNIVWITLFSCLLTIAVVFIYMSARGLKIRSELRFRKIGIGTILLSLAVGLVMNFATGYIISVLPIPEQVIADYNELVGDNLFSGGFVISFIAMAVVVPFTEELVFRGMSFNFLRRGMALTLALILQSLLFAGIHMIPLQVAYVLPTAVTLGLIYMWTDNLIAPVLAHISYNGFSAIISMLQVTEDAAEVAETVNYLPHALIAVAIVIGLMYLLYRSRVRPIPVPHHEWKPRKQRFAPQMPYPGAYPQPENIQQNGDISNGQ